MRYPGVELQRSMYKKKKPFSKVKSIYGDHMQNYKSKAKTTDLTKKEKAELKEKISKNIKRQKIRDNTITGVIFVIVLLFVLTAVYLFGKGVL